MKWNVESSKCEHTNLESQHELIDPGKSGFKDLKICILIKIKTKLVFSPRPRANALQKQFKGIIEP